MPVPCAVAAGQASDKGADASPPRPSPSFVPHAALPYREQRQRGQGGASDATDAHSQQCVQALGEEEGTREGPAEEDGGGSD